MQIEAQKIKEIMKVSKTSYNGKVFMTFKKISGISLLVLILVSSNSLFAYDRSHAAWLMDPRTLVAGAAAGTAIARLYTAICDSQISLNEVVRLAHGHNQYSSSSDVDRRISAINKAAEEGLSDLGVKQVYLDEAAQIRTGCGFSPIPIQNPGKSRIWFRRFFYYAQRDVRAGGRCVAGKIGSGLSAGASWFSNMSQFRRAGVRGGSDSHGCNPDVRIY